MISNIMDFIAPVMHLLVQGTDAVMKEAARIAGAAWPAVEKLWARLRPDVDNTPAAIEVKHALVAQPDEPDTQAAMRFHVQQILKRDEKLVRQLIEIIKDAQGQTSQ